MGEKERWREGDGEAEIERGKGREDGRSNRDEEGEEK